MDRLICKKDLVLLLFPHKTYVLDILLDSPQCCDSNKYPKIMLLEVLMQFSKTNVLA